MSPETSLYETYVFLGRFLHKKTTQLIKYAPQCQLCNTKVADEIINM